MVCNLHIENTVAWGFMNINEQVLNIIPIILCPTSIVFKSIDSRFYEIKIMSCVMLL